MKPKTFTKKWLMITDEDGKMLMCRKISPTTKVYTKHTCFEADSIGQVRDKIVDDSIKVSSDEKLVSILVLDKEQVYVKKQVYIKEKKIDNVLEKI